MNVTNKICPIHNIRMARFFEQKIESDGRVTIVRQVNVRYYCRVCRAKEELEKVRATIPKH